MEAASICIDMVTRWARTKPRQAAGVAAGLALVVAYYGLLAPPPDIYYGGPHPRWVQAHGREAFQGKRTPETPERGPTGHAVEGVPPGPLRQATYFRKREVMQEQLDAMRASREACKDWKDTLAVERDPDFVYIHYASKEEYQAGVFSNKNTDGDHMHSTNKRDVDAQKERAKQVRHQMCVGPALDDPTQTWSFQRFGPFDGTGGYDWNIAISKNLLRELPLDGSMVITGNYLNAGTEDYTPLYQPPMHMHHLHVVNVGRQFPEVFERHAEINCKEPHGGATCMMDMLPEGFGYTLDMDFEFETHQNDIRAAAEGLELMPFYLELNFKVAPRKTHVLATHVSLATMGSARMFAATIPLPKEPSLSWSSHSLPMSGYYTWYDVHTHIGRFDEAWFYSGEPEAAGLDTGVFKRPAVEAWTPIATGTGQLEFLTMPEVKELLTARLEIWRGKAGHVRMSGNICKIKKETDGGDGHIFEYDGKKYTSGWRDTVTPCLSQLDGHYRAGDAITSIWFGLGGTEDRWPQHQLLRGLMHRYNEPVLSAILCLEETTDRQPGCLSPPEYLFWVLCGEDPNYVALEGVGCPPRPISYLFRLWYDMGFRPFNINQIGGFSILV